MNSHVRRAAILALFAIVSMPASRLALAQDAPKPSPEIQRMTALAGTFDGEASFTENGKTVKFTLHHQNKVVAGGFGLQSHEDADLPGMGHYEAENLFGWDEGKRQLHLLTVSNDPSTHDHAGPWTDATHATLRYEGLKGGKKYVEVIPMNVVSADEYRFHCTTTLDGKPLNTFDAVMKRVSPMSAR